MATTKALTTKGERTRERIVVGAAAEVREHGVAETTLDDILASTRTSKGQLFHYFPGGRRELLVAVARYEADRVLSDQQPHLGTLRERASWLAWRDVVVARYLAQGTQCPLNTLSAGLGRDSPEVRAIQLELMDRWWGQLVEGVRRLYESEGPADGRPDPERAASALLAALQGGVTLMLTTGSITHLEAALGVVFASLLGSDHDPDPDRGQDTGSDRSTVAPGPEATGRRGQASEGGGNQEGPEA